MKEKILLLLLLLPSSSWANEHTGAFGLEAGVARLSDGSTSAIGPSLVSHFEYQIDQMIGFFGQAGKSEAKDGNDQFTQTSFNGGILLDVLPILEFRVGIASTILEIENENSTKKKNELGPLAGATVYMTEGIWKLGASGMVIRTSSLHSAAMRLMLLMMF
jgi:hypothetical protein